MLAFPHNLTSFVTGTLDLIVAFTNGVSYNHYSDIKFENLKLDL